MKTTCFQPFSGEPLYAIYDATQLQTAEEAAAYLRARLDPTVFWVYRGGSHVAIHVENGREVKGARLAILVESETPTRPAAACPRCGGWTSFGGMSQHSDPKKLHLGRFGCNCH
jgi:hypothetical protein